MYSVTIQIQVFRKIFLEPQGARGQGSKGTEGAEGGRSRVRVRIRVQIRVRVRFISRTQDK